MRVCVFCGSSPGNDPVYGEAAAAAARAIATTGATIVFGGGRVGLMGIVADAALSAGGTVVGVMPRSLVEREIAHNGLHQLHVVETMHERKTNLPSWPMPSSRFPVAPARWKKSSSNGHGANSASTPSRADFSTSRATSIPFGQ
jgi:Possible lysine decarboxylase